MFRRKLRARYEIVVESHTAKTGAGFAEVVQRVFTRNKSDARKILEICPQSSAFSDPIHLQTGGYLVNAYHLTWDLDDRHYKRLERIARTDAPAYMAGEFRHAAYDLDTAIGIYLPEYVHKHIAEIAWWLYHMIRAGESGALTIELALNKKEYRI